MMNNYTIWVDGASSGVMVGPAAAAWYAQKNDEFLQQGGLYLTGSNNEAEITAVYLAVKFFSEVSEPQDKLLVIGDSQWALYCLAKKIDHPKIPHWATEKYPEIFKDIVALWDGSRMRLNWVRREHNTKADKLSKQIKIRGY